LGKGSDLKSHLSNTQKTLPWPNVKEPSF